VIVLGSLNAAPVPCSTLSGGSGHYYEYITSSKTWNNAKTDAAAAKHNSVSSHLVTMTSATEANFLKNDVVITTSGRLWTGGSD
jgi:hypothetical protein